MTWVLWRQHRLTWGVVWAIVASLAMLLVYVHQQADATTAAFLPSLLVTVPLLLPLLAGLFIGVPVLAQEFERKTYHLSWTQGISRRRWYALEAAAVVGVLLVAAAALSLVMGWSYSKEILAKEPSGGAFVFPYFDVIGVAPVAYSVFAVALGICLGALCKRTLVAMLLCFVVFVGLRATVELGLRPYLQPPVVSVAHITSSVPPGAPSGAWKFYVGTRLPDGTYADQFPFLYGEQACPQLAKKSGIDQGGMGDSALWRCLDRAGYRWVVQWQPANRWWTFQIIEGAIYVCLAVILLLATLLGICRRA